MLILRHLQGYNVGCEETDAIQLLIPYAEEQGSKNANKLYMTYSKLVNKVAGVSSGKRGFATRKELMIIAMLEDMLSQTILEEMEKGVYYKHIYRPCNINKKVDKIGVFGLLKVAKMPILCLLGNLCLKIAKDTSAENYRSVFSNGII